jgi:hypothetical protein
MPVHDWKKVPDGIYHAFHHGWIQAISDDLNSGRLPADYYALPEQVAAGLGPDLLTLQAGKDTQFGGRPNGNGPVATVIRPTTRFMVESEGDFHRRKKSWIAVRHVSGDRVVAIVEIVSPGNKASDHAFRKFVDKALELVEQRVHLLIVDPLPPGRRDPNGIHAAIWEEYSGESFQLPPDKPLTLVSYECALTTRAYIQPIAIGDRLPDMALFLEPECCILVPLETTYAAAYQVMPRRWRDVLDAG